MESFEFHKYLYLYDRTGEGRLLGAIHGDYKKGWKYTGGKVNPSYVFSLQIGSGAGYKHGITFFFARYSGSANWWRTFRGKYWRHTPFGFEIGWTRNGNKVPYVSH